MSGMEMMALQAASGAMKIQAARSEAKGLAAQATFARTQARSEALKYKQQGVQVLDNILRSQASITARAAAGGISAGSGSAKYLATLAEAKGAGEYYTTREGQIIQTRTGELKAGEYMREAKAGMRNAIMGAALGMGMQGYNQGLLGEAPSQGATVALY